MVLICSFVVCVRMSVCMYVCVCDNRHYIGGLMSYKFQNFTKGGEGKCHKLNCNGGK